MPVLSDLAIDGPTVRVEFDPRWAVRSMFGGAVAAVAVRAARAALGIELPLAEGLFSFLAPTPPGPAVITVQATRLGRRFASADVAVVSSGELVMRANVVFSAGAMPSESADGAAAPCAGVATFGGDVEWYPDVPAADGTFTSWVRAARGASVLAPDEWLCIAADIIGPAIVPATHGAFAVSTALLSVIPMGVTRPTEWISQSAAGVLSEGVASGTVALRDPSGRLLARATQRAVLFPMESSADPRLVTAFANSDIHSNLFGLN